MKFRTLLTVLVLAGCETVTPEKAPDYPTGFICRLLNPNEYITTPDEQKILYAELERRGKECDIPDSPDVMVFAF